MVYKSEKPRSGTSDMVLTQTPTSTNEFTQIPQSVRALNLAIRRQDSPHIIHTAPTVYWLSRVIIFNVLRRKIRCLFYRTRYRGFRLDGVYYLFCVLQSVMYSRSKFFWHDGFMKTKSFMLAINQDNSDITKRERPHQTLFCEQIDFISAYDGADKFVQASQLVWLQGRTLKQNNDAAIVIMIYFPQVIRLYPPGMTAPYYTR